MVLIFFFKDTATTEIYTLSLHDALPILHVGRGVDGPQAPVDGEGFDRGRRREALRGDHLEGVPRAHVLDDPRDSSLELLAGHVGLESDVARPCRCLHGRYRLPKPLPHLAD